MSYYQTPATILIFIGIILSLSQCGSGSNLHYTVPDDYQGFLVIRYNCPDGNLLIDENEKRHVVFQDNGTACIEDYMPSGIIIKPSVKTKSGREIQFKGSSYQNETGYALIDVGVTAYGSKPKTPLIEADYFFSVLWVGDLDELNDLMNSGEYETEKHEFISRHFDLGHDY